MKDRNLIIIPTYEESENISDIIEAIFGLELPFEILIVDDNSSDGTKEIIKSFEDKRINLFNFSNVSFEFSRFANVFKVFQNSTFCKKSISWNGIWIAGRPWSRWDPPGRRKTQNNGTI